MFKKKGVILEKGMMLFVCIVAIHFVHALPQDEGSPIYHSEPPINYSTVEVNNSQFFDGYSVDTLWTYFSGLGDALWLAIDGSNANQDIDINGYSFSGGLGSTFGDGTNYWNFTTVEIGGNTFPVLEPHSEIGEYGFIMGGLYIQDLVTGSTPFCLYGDGVSAWCFVNDYDDTLGHGEGTLVISDYGTMSGEIYIDGNQTTTGNILPAVTLTQDLGSGANRWRWLYVQNISSDYGDFAYDVNIDGDLQVDGSMNVTNLTVKNMWIIDMISSGNITADWFNGKYNWTSGDDWNNFDGSTLTFNASKLATTYYNATQVSAVAGTIDGGTLINTQHPDGDYDGVTFNFSEEAGSPGLELYVNFTDVDSFNGGIMRYKTSSLSGDFPVIQLWSYTESIWHDFPQVAENDDSFVTIREGVFDNVEHIQDGVVQMRLYKASNGNTNNHYYIDWLAVTKGFGTPSAEEVDPFFEAWLNNPVLEMNLSMPNYNVTADYFFGDGSELTNLPATNFSSYQETIIDEDFSSGTLWDEGGDWSIGSGVATYLGTNGGILQPDPVLDIESGKYYVLEFDVNSISKTTTVSFGGISEVISSGETGHHIIYGTTSSTANLKFTVTAFFIPATVIIDNVVLTEYEPIEMGRIDATSISTDIFEAGSIDVDYVNDVNITALSTGFSISGGTTSRTLKITGNSQINQNLLTSSSPTFGLVKTTSGVSFDGNNPPYFSSAGDEGGVNLGVDGLRDGHLDIQSASNKPLNFIYWNVGGNKSVEFGYDGDHYMNVTNATTFEFRNDSGYSKVDAYDFITHTSVSDLDNALGSAQDRSELVDKDGNVVDANFRNSVTRIVQRIIGYEEVGLNEFNLTIKEPIYEEEEVVGVSVVGMVTDHEQMLFNANERIVSLEQENQMLKDELCSRDNSYSWCLGGELG